MQTSDFGGLGNQISGVVWIDAVPQIDAVRCILELANAASSGNRIILEVSGGGSLAIGSEDDGVWHGGLGLSGYDDSLPHTVAFAVDHTSGTYWLSVDGNTTVTSSGFTITSIAALDALYVGQRKNGDGLSGLMPRLTLFNSLKTPAELEVLSS